MKTIGLIGGMSWESTRAYYEIINQTVKERLGGLHSAKLLLYSMDFAELEPYQTRSEWDRASAMLTDAAQRLETAGADFLVLCSNTAHKIAPEISAAVRSRFFISPMRPFRPYRRRAWRASACSERAIR